MPFLLEKLCSRHQLIYFNLKYSNKNLRFIQSTSCLLRKSLYDILGVNINASPNEIKKAYFEKSKLYHPDRTHLNGKKDAKKQNKLFLSVQKAYETLGNPDLKDEYDKKTFGRVSTDRPTKTPKKDIRDTQSDLYHHIKRKPLKRTKAERQFELMQINTIEQSFQAKRETHESYEEFNRRKIEERRDDFFAPIWVLVIIFFVVICIMI